MFHWRDDKDGPEPWRGSVPAELCFGDPDAWRGGAAADPEAWRTGAGAKPSTVDPLRPDILEHGWPSSDVGPEYRMWKERGEKDR